MRMCTNDTTPCVNTVDDTIDNTVDDTPQDSESESDIEIFFVPEGVENFTISKRRK